MNYLIKIHLIFYVDNLKFASRGTGDSTAIYDACLYTANMGQIPSTISFVSLKFRIISEVVVNPENTSYSSQHLPKVYLNNKFDIILEQFIKAYDLIDQTMEKYISA